MMCDFYKNKTHKLWQTQLFYFQHDGIYLYLVWLPRPAASFTLALFSCYADKCNITKNLSGLSPGFLAEASKTLGISWVSVFIMLMRWLLVGPSIISAFRFLAIDLQGVKGSLEIKFSDVANNPMMPMHKVLTKTLDTKGQTIQWLCTKSQ